MVSYLEIEQSSVRRLIDHVALLIDVDRREAVRVYEFICPIRGRRCRDLAVL